MVEMKKKYLYGKYIQDGMLDRDCGRIVIYDGQILHANSQSADHNYLLRSLAARILEDKDRVIAGAIRLYFKREDDRIIVSPVRRLDDDMFRKNWDEYKELIKKVVK